MSEVPRRWSVIGSALLATAAFLIAPAPALAACPCSIWPSSAAPVTAAATSDRSPVEVGVKFRSQVAGTITALRFYKGPTNTGTHVGHLWSRSGTLLATATFTGETATGWQQVALPSPVPITADTTYVASYHAPNGNYAFDMDFFTVGVENPPLRALRDGEDLGNGVYRYGPSGSFPNATYRAAQYWVDVVLAADTGPDTTPPTVTAEVPAGGAQNVAPDGRRHGEVQ